MEQAGKKTELRKMLNLNIPLKKDVRSQMLSICMGLHAPGYVSHLLAASDISELRI